MQLVVYSRSHSFATFLQRHLDRDFQCREDLASLLETDKLHLLHISSLQDEAFEKLLQISPGDSRIAVCADLPNIGEMLESVRLGAKAYCNSYMAALHYQQMLQQLENGQSWFPPQLLEQTFSLAHQASNTQVSTKSLDALTSREKEIALAVAEGKSNREISTHFDISERTVKAHLTNIFKKLQLKDRVGLVLHLKAS